MAIMSYEERQRIQRALADEQLKQAAQQRRQDDTAVLNTAKQTVDKQVQEVTAGYRQQQQQATDDTWAMLERNALDEALNRQAVDQRMANLGLTNSGLAVSSQEAVTVRRNYRDQQEKRQLSEYVAKLEEAISQAQAEGEAKKDALQQTSDAKFNDWYTSLEQKAYNNADKTAAQLYEDDLKAQEAIEKAKAAAAKAQAEAAAKAQAEAAKAQAQVAKAQAEAAKKAATKQTDSSTKKNTTANTTPTAQTTAPTPEPSGSSGTNTTQYAAIDRALDSVSNWDASSGGIFNKTFWSGPDGDGQNVYEDIVEEQLFSSQAYKNLSTADKHNAVAIAIGKSVATTWPGKGDATKNITRLRSALLAAQKKLNWSAQTLTQMQQIAAEAYRGLA